VRSTEHQLKDPELALPGGLVARLFKGLLQRGNIGQVGPYQRQLPDRCQGPEGAGPLFQGLAVQIAHLQGLLPRPDYGHKLGSVLGGQDKDLPGLQPECQVTDASGKALTPKGNPFHLCRCGASANKPFCDGQHKKIEFKG